MASEIGGVASSGRDHGSVSLDAYGYSTGYAADVEYTALFADTPAFRCACVGIIGEEIDTSHDSASYESPIDLISR